MVETTPGSGEQAGLASRPLVCNILRSRRWNQ